MTDKLFKILILLPFMWSFTGLLLLRNGDKLMVVAIVVSIIATLLNYGIDSIKQNIHDKGLWLVLTVTGYAVFSYYYHGASSREMRTLLGTTLLLLTFPRELINARILKWLTVLGSIVLFLSTYYFSVVLHLPRANWPINAIPHGTMGATITVLSLVFLINAKNYRDRIILAFALLMSVSGLVMNPTRGIWLALIIAVMIILFSKLKIKQINWKYVLISMVILSLATYAAKAKFEQRIKYTQAEITKIQSGNLNTSIGIRLQLWMAASKISTTNPILGNGDNHQLLLEQLAEQDVVTKIVTRFSHYHNQYLDQMVKRGIIGVILLFAVLIYPLLSTSKGINRQIAIAVVTVYAVAGLTDVPLNHGAPLFMYLLLMFTLKKNNEASC
ncbi:O-antigen ligase family protein [Moritella marina]|uniref:O-antigen ligase family protein n=1 Tax=Moritella marina TaxID=90736 RepID=UPI003704AF8E